MNIHEYQAKDLLKKYGVAVPAGIPAMSVDEAVKACDQLPGASLYVVKAQIHAGGRGAGKFKNNPKVATGLYSSAAQFDLQVSQADRDAVRGAYTQKYGQAPTDAWVTQYLSRKIQGAKK